MWSEREPRADDAKDDGEPAVGKRPRASARAEGAARAAAGGEGDATRAAIDPRIAAMAGAGERPPTMADAASAAVAHKGGGRAIDQEVAGRVGAHLGADFSGVRVHDDPLSREATGLMGARAFAYGGDVFLGSDESDRDVGLMAHELTHVAQQGAAGPAAPGATKRRDDAYPAAAPALGAQRKVEVGAANSPAEHEADAVAAAVTGGSSGPAKLLVDEPPVAPGQMLKSTFVDELRGKVMEAADAELGLVYSAIGCPYIDQYFGRYAGRAAADGEAMLKRFAPETRAVRTAADMIPIVVERVRLGVRHWRDTGKPPPGLEAMAGGAPGAAAGGAGAATPVANTASLLARLGDGAALAGDTAARMSAALDQDVSRARVHTGPAAHAMAADLGARAFAVGPHVVMGAGYEPGTLRGDALLAHELAHVGQQQEAAAAPGAALAPIEGEDAGAEADADAATVGAIGRMVGGAKQVAARARDAVKTGLRLQRCGDTPDLAGARNALWGATQVVGGDAFRFDAYLSYDGKANITDFHIDGTYAGDDDCLQTEFGFGNRVPNGPAKNQLTFVGDADNWSAARFDLLGDGAQVVELRHAVKPIEAWSPPARSHRFELVVNGKGQGHWMDIVVKPKASVPARTTAAGAPLAADSPLKVGEEAGGAMGVSTAIVIAKRRLDALLADPVIDLGKAPALATLKQQVDGDHAKYATASTADPALATRLTHFADQLDQAKVPLTALGLGSKPEAYLPDIAERATAMVGGVRDQFVAAVAAAYTGGDAAAWEAAQAAFNAVWYRVAALYLDRNKGIDKLVRDGLNLREDVPSLRNKGGRGAHHWPRIEAALGIPPRDKPAQDDDSVFVQAGRLAQQVRTEFENGQPGALKHVSQLTDQVQLYTGVCTLIVACEQFHVFYQALDSLVDKLPPQQRPVAKKWIDRLTGLIDKVEAADARGVKAMEAESKTAIAAFQALVHGKEFTDDLASIQDRLKTIQVVNVMAKVLVIVGAAALTAGAAGAAVGGALEGAGATAGVIAAGQFGAEVVAFTLANRLGNELVFGDNPTGLGEDLITNTLMFGFLKAATAGYGRVFKVFADPKLAPKAYAVGAAATGLVSLQAFAEMHFRVKEGHWMEGGDRARSIAQNTVMLVCLGLGQWIAKPMEARIKGKALEWAVTNFKGGLEGLAAERAALKGELDALLADPTGAAAAEQAPALIAKIERLWNSELKFLAEAAKKEGATGSAEFKAAVQQYVDQIARLDLQLAQAGIEAKVGPGGGDLFRPVASGVIAFQDAGKAVLEAYYKEHGGKLEKLEDGTYAGKIGAEETFYVPESKAREWLAAEPEVAGLKDTVDGPKKLGATSDLAKEREAGHATAEQAGAKIGGAKGKTVAEIDALGVDTAVQIEADLRVMDPLFGKKASDGFGKAAREIDAELAAATGDRGALEAAAAALRRARGTQAGVMNTLLEILRDPSRDLATRKKDALAQIKALEDAVAGTRLPADAIDFAAARKAVEGLTGEMFADMVVTDADGNLTKGGKKWGTFRELMDRVLAANRAYRKNGVPKEFVIGVATPKNPTAPRQVLVLTREPTGAKGPDNLPPKLPGLDGSVDPEGKGYIVDIGVGESSYALDMVPDADRTGPMVGTEYGPKYLDAAMSRRDLTWEKTAGRVEADSVVVLGDALQTLSMMFPARSVKRLFINNINAGYDAGAYAALARGLRTVMMKGGQVEVQWDTSPEYPGGKPGDRGHVDGPGLEAALKATAADVPRPFKVDKDALPIKDYQYSVEASRRVGPAEKDAPASPVPEFRWIFVLE